VDDTLKTEFRHSVETVDAAVRRFRELSTDRVESAVSHIVHTVNVWQADPDVGYLDLVVDGLGAIARLYYVRYHSDPHHPATDLWSAVRLFGMIRRAPRRSVSIPADIEVMLDVLAAKDLAVLPEIEDPDLAIDTAVRLAEFAVVASDVAALHRAEGLARRVLDRVPDSYPHRDAVLSNLLGILVKRWELTGADVSDEIERVVDTLVRRAGQLDTRSPVVLANAGSACYLIGARTHNQHLLDRAVALLEPAVEAIPDGAPEKAGFLQNLGRAELLRWGEQGRDGHRESAVVHLRNAVDRTVPGDPDAADRHAWLGFALLTGDRPEVGDAACQLERAEELALVPDVRVQPGLHGQAWLSLWRADPSDQSSLDKAIALLDQAGGTRASAASPDLSETLAEALWERWERTRGIDDIDELIATLMGRAERDDASPLVLNLLARSLRARWERTGDSVAIRHAIECLSSAIERLPASDSAIAMYHNNLASMSLRLHQATAEPSAIREGIRHARRALERCTEDDPNRPMYANTAALTYLSSWQRTGATAALRLAVEFSRSATAGTARHHPDHTSHLANLGAVLTQAARHLDDLSLLTEAIEALRAALDGTSPAHPVYGGLLLNLGQALLVHGRAVGDRDAVAHGQDLLRESVDRPFVRPEDAIHAARSWADEAAAAGDWSSAADALCRAVDQLASFSGHRLNRLDHERQLMRAAGLGTDGAAACCNNGADRRVVECLEAGRGVLLAKSLRHDRAFADLELHDAALAERLRHVRSRLESGPDLVG